jgi:hypothetical protein
MLETKLTITEAIKAEKKPLTAKPGTKTEVKESIIALITSKNRPKVKIVNGIVRIVKIGLIKPFTKPKTTAAKKPAQTPVTVIPGSK